MASKFISIYLLFHLAILAIQLEAGGALPTIHFNATVSSEDPAPITLVLLVDEILKGSTQLRPGQSSYEINVEVDDVYAADAIFGLRCTAFHAYEPARDKGQAAVYWKADDDGFAISHDNTLWKLVAPWKSETIV